MFQQKDRGCGYAAGLEAAGAVRAPVKCTGRDQKKQGAEVSAPCRLIQFPRECRLAGILNLGSEGPLSCRFRFARRERSQQRRLWAAADANGYWFKECMALANTAGETRGSQAIPSRTGGATRLRTTVRAAPAIRRAWLRWNLFYAESTRVQEPPQLPSECFSGPAIHGPDSAPP